MFLNFSSNLKYETPHRTFYITSNRTLYFFISLNISVVSFKIVINFQITSKDKNK